MNSINPICNYRHSFYLDILSDDQYVTHLSILTENSLEPVDADCDGVDVAAAIIDDNKGAVVVFGLNIRVTGCGIIAGIRCIDCSVIRRIGLFISSCYDTSSN
jgi:hypothetical protein